MTYAGGPVAAATIAAHLVGDGYARAGAVATRPGHELADAFRVSQNHDCEWARGARSTSRGDVLVVDGPGGPHAHVVGRAGGFDELAGVDAAALL